MDKLKIFKYVKTGLKIAVMSILLGLGLSSCKDGSNGGLSHTHDYSDWGFDEEGHWRKCPDDGTIDQSTKGAHIKVQGPLYQEATEGAPGWNHEICSVCGFVMTNEMIPQLAMSHDHTPTGTWSAWTSDNNSTHSRTRTVCTDPDCTIKDIGTETKTHEDRDNTWTNDPAPTLTSPGSAYRDCNDCGHEMERKDLPKLEQDWTAELATRRSIADMSAILPTTGALWGIPMGLTNKALDIAFTLQGQAATIRDQYSSVGTPFQQEMRTRQMEISGGGTTLSLAIDRHPATITTIGTLFSDPADLALFNKRVQAYQMAHRIAGRDTGNGFAPQFDGNTFANLTTLCGELGIDMTVNASNLSEIINALTGQMINGMPSELGDLKYNLIQQIQNFAQSEAWMKSAQEKGAAIAEVDPKLRNLKPREAVQQENGIYV